MCPENGSSRHMKSNASSSRSAGTRHATSAPGARFVAMSVCRMRRMVPDASMARSRSSTVSRGRSASRAISPKGSTRKPAMRSSETARMRALIGSSISVGTGRLDAGVEESVMVIPENSTVRVSVGLARGVQAPTLVRHRKRPRIVSAAPMRASLAALGAFALVALLDEPTPLDQALYALARRLYDRNLELAQRPLEIFGLPGVHIPVALVLARRLRRRGRRGNNVIA